MLYKVERKNNKLEPIEFKGIDGNEKDLENLIAKNMKEMFCEEAGLMPIFQERQWQEEADILALDAYGNLVILELKRYTVPSETTLQILRYAQIYGRKVYSELANLYKIYMEDDTINLAEKHYENFGLPTKLRDEEFNRKQRLVIIGNSSDNELITAVEYWREQGLDIDFTPYRFYKIGESEYFEFFAKPYDSHWNPADVKGIMFDTNESHRSGSIWKMFQGNKISAYGNVKELVNRFSKNDYALFYHKGYGVVAMGRIVSGKAQFLAPDEMYQTVEWIVPKELPTKLEELRYATVSEIEKKLEHGFYYARTDKAPFLTGAEVEMIKEILENKYCC
ncbi:MAG: DUF91 domain-containing protein [Clostridiales bacterium]|nr:DUF91 domain-containing protein [Clostridiales bacterium]